jgi:hypothetical protein
MKRSFLIAGVGLVVLIGASTALLPSALGVRTVHAAATHRPITAALAVASSRDLVLSARTTAARQAALQLRQGSGLSLAQRASRLAGPHRYNTSSTPATSYAAKYSARYGTRYAARASMAYARAGSTHTGHNCPGMTSTRTGK